ncbi:hypothetical protein [Actinoplanes derwentensis]|uniref:Uncharacterized protein n=1 Tax=Actinoplanes derwentensis TaxID=113562 RepID=A0A1H1XMC5_9ACTN|nr:hypothetical protein [Actinoplanes derwentensis]GID87722.1 hypothetical protein Ade03nite_66460 [Actinoplanes derwentensis]SDT10368.1 hypothetical protein SAMN04489716_2515 [Actinoplanes derwentensis]
MTTPDTRTVVQFHQLLLRLAGWAPDDTIRDARDLLARGLVTDVAARVVETVVSDRVPIRPQDAGLLAATVPDLPETVMLMNAAEAGENERPAVEFVPSLPDPLTMTPPPMLLDLTGTGTLDPLDAAVVEALDQVAGPVALWRAWRLPQHDRPAGTPPIPVYLLETAGDAAGRPGAAAWIQSSIAAAGRDDAQVEVFGSDAELPPYQRSARGRSALLWAAAPAEPVTVARVFDSYTPETGGQFDPEHPLLAGGDEATRVLDYLNQGHVLLATTMREPDVFDTDAGPVVPSSFRTDGRFVWTDAVGYYLRTYALSPDAELLDHVRERDFAAPEVDAVAEHRALAALMG